MLIGILSVIILILLVVIGFLIKVVIIQSKKNEIYEKWILDIQTRVEVVMSTMIALDNRQMFSKDDEVGSIFSQMVDLVKSLNQIVSKE